MKRLLVVILFLVISFPAFIHSQTLLKDSVVNFSMLHVHYGVQFPFADLSDRFGLNHSMGIGFSVKNKRNVFIGVEGSFMFGNNVKEDDILDSITGAGGSLIASSGLLTSYKFSEKGFNLKVQGGKIIPFKKPNVNSGLMALLGAGYLQHKISIDVNDDAPMLSKEYKKGYDRLTGGFMLSQFIGYFFLDHRHKRINCYAGIEIIEGFTKSLRNWNYDEHRKDDSRRTDILITAKFGWVIPFYRSQTEKYYYY